MGNNLIKYEELYDKFDLNNIILFILHYLLITITKTHDRCHYCCEKTVLPLGKI